MAQSYYYRAYGRVVDIDTNEELRVGVDIGDVEIKWDNSSSLEKTAPTDGSYEDGYIYLRSSEYNEEDLDIFCTATLPNDPLISFAKLELKIYSKNSAGDPEQGTLENTYTKTTNNTITSWDAFDTIDDIGAGSSSSRMPMVFTVYVKRLPKTLYANVKLLTWKYSDLSNIPNAGLFNLTSYDGLTTSKTELIANEFVECSFNLSEGICKIGVESVETNPGLEYVLWRFELCDANGIVIQTDYKYTEDVIAESDGIDIYSFLRNYNSTRDNTVQIFLTGAWNGEADPDWEPTPPVDPDPPTPPSGSNTDYLAYVDGGVLGYTSSGHLALA